MRGRNLVWTRHVNYRLGAYLAMGAERLRLTPNQLTLLNVAFATAGAATVLASPTHTLLSTITVLVLWQLAFALDCADGLLARMQERTSAFGAWIDQLADFASHLVIAAALSAHVVRSLGVEPVGAVGLASLFIGSSLLQGFAAAQRDAYFGAQPKRHLVPSGPLSLARPAIHLTDYGIYLAATAAALAFPAWLLAVLVASLCLTLLSTTAQVIVLRRASPAPSG